jgi:hypothetical protein
MDGSVPHAALYDETTDSLIIRAVQDVEPILENNKRLYNESDGYSPSREWRRAASIPDVIVLDWWKHGINILSDEHWPLIASLLDRPEYRDLRTAPGRLSRRPWREHFTMRGRWRTRRPLSDAL